MTVVRMPVRVRLELTAAQLDPAPGRPDGDQVNPMLTGLVGEALMRATGRAVDRARALQVVRRHECREPRSEVTVCFCGDPLPDALAADLEARVRAVLGVAAARLVALPVPAASPQRRGGEEPLDYARRIVDPYQPDGDLYLVPSYDRGGGPAAASLRRDPAAAGRTAAQRPKTALRLRTLATSEEVWAAVVKLNGRAPTEPLVAVAAMPNGDHTAWVFRPTSDGGYHVVWTTIGPWVPKQEGIRPGPGGLSALADELQFVARVDTEVEFQRFLERRVMPDIIRSASPELTEAAELKLPEQAAKRAAEVKWQGTAYFYEWLSGGENVGWLYGNVQIFTGVLPVVVLTEEVPVEGSQHPGDGGECPPLDLRSDDEVDATRPYLGEPRLLDWPPNYYAEFSPMVQQTADLLRIEPGQFAGSFCLAALRKIEQHSGILALLGSATTRLEELRQLAAAFLPLNNLAHAYTSAVLERQNHLPCPMPGNGGTWTLHFYEMYTPMRREAVASMFKTACQDVLLGVLERSAREIEGKLANFAKYMADTRLLLLIVLGDTVELSNMRDALAADANRRAVVAADDRLGLQGLDPVTAWQRATVQLVEAYQLPSPSVAGQAPGTVAFRDGAYRVLDSNGRWWTREQLEAAIALDRETAFGIDPVLEKVSAIPDLVRRLREAQRQDNALGTPGGGEISKAVDAEFKQLLNDLGKENEYWQRRVAKERLIAFGLATFAEASEKTEHDFGAELSGIHRLADERLRPMFADERVYTDGMRELAHTELGKQELEEIVNWIIVPLLAVVFAPAAEAIMVVQALSSLRTAFEHQGIQRAMLGGDEIITKAQVEAEMWAARVNAALVFLPKVPGVVRMVGSGARAIARGEGRAWAVAEAQAAMSRAIAQLAAVTAEDFLAAFAKEVAKSYVLNLAISAAMNRFTAAVVAEVKVSGRADVADLPDLIARSFGPVAGDGGAP